MIVTEGPTLEEKLIKVTPWWDVVSKYLIAAMMAIALTSIVTQITKDNVICVPAVDCSRSTASNGSLAVNVSDASTKLCQSLSPKSSKKKVLTKMVDRRFYDYVDSVCFQELSWFTKFFPLILLVEAVFLLVFDILWTKLPYSSSVLNHFVDLAEESYSSLATIDIILGKITADSSSSDPPPIPKADALKVLSLAEKAKHFRETYAGKNTKQVSQDAKNEEQIKLEEIDAENEPTEQPNKPENDKNRKKFLSIFKFYITRTVLQIVICISSFVIDMVDTENFFRAFGKSFQFKCHIDEFVFTQEYDHMHFECSHPLAPYLQIAVMLFLLFLSIHLVISCIALYKVRKGSTYTFPKKSEDEESKTSTKNDFAFLFFLLTQHDKVYADRVSYFFRPGENIQGNILSFMEKAKSSNN